MLLALKQALMRRKTANLTELSQDLNVEAEVIREMLTHWIAKGQVKKTELPAGCGSKCVKCLPQLREVYSWVEPTKRL